MHRFDSSRAWRDASAAVAANREVLLALAGVFFMLPWLAFMLLAPAPQMKPEMSAEQIMASFTVYLGKVGPYLLALTLVEAAGTLSVLTLCTDRSRPTVGEAIRRGAIGVLPYLGAMFLFALAFTAASGVLGLLAGLAGGLAGGKVLTALAGMIANLALIYATVRLILVAPVIAVERVYQPWRVLVRSWRLTRGHVARILLFLVLLVVASEVIMWVIGMIVGSVATLVAGQATGHLVEAVVSAAMIGVFLLTMTAVLAAIHTQLAGPTVADDR